MTRSFQLLAPALLVGLVGAVRPAAAQEDDIWASNDPLIVEIDPTGPRDRASVRATSVAVETVIKEIARKSGRVVEGLDGSSRAALVTVELRDRPIQQVLEFILGSCDMRAELRPGILAVYPEDSGELSVERMRERAMVHYLSATARFREHPAAERGRLSQGEVEEARGNDAAALEQYQTLLDNFPGSQLKLEAHLRSGRALEALGRFAEAASEYRIASASPTSTPQHGPARLGLARCQIALGEPDLAEIMVDTLDDQLPARDRTVAAERGMVRARAQLHCEEEVEALATLDQLDRLGLPESLLAESMELRALAFEGLELYREASRFWLIHAGESEGFRRDQSFTRAARLAVTDDDPLGVLFVAAEAARVGSAADLGAMARTARLELGLLVDLDASGVTDVERLDISERWVAEQRHSAARPVLSDLHARRLELNPSLRPRIALAWASVLYAEDGLESALAALREGRAAIDVNEEREPLDLMAAELLERERQFVRAVAAYEGRY